MNKTPEVIVRPKITLLAKVFLSIAFIIVILPITIYGYCFYIGYQGKIAGIERRNQISLSIDAFERNTANRDLKKEWEKAIASNSSKELMGCLQKNGVSGFFYWESQNSLRYLNDGNTDSMLLVQNAFEVEFQRAVKEKNEVYFISLCRTWVNSVHGIKGYDFNPNTSIMSACYRVSFTRFGLKALSNSDLRWISKNGIATIRTLISQTDISLSQFFSNLLITIEHDKFISPSSVSDIVILSNEFDDKSSFFLGSLAFTKLSFTAKINQGLYRKLQNAQKELETQRDTILSSISSA